VDIARRKRRSFTAEFKAEAVKKVLNDGLTVAEVAEELELTESGLREWVKKAKASQERMATGGSSDAEREELVRLRKEVKTLREDREILKRAATFFTKEKA
jgi:transposase